MSAWEPFDSGYVREDTRHVDLYYVADADWTLCGTFARHGRMWIAEAYTGWTQRIETWRACVRWLLSKPEPPAAARGALSADVEHTLEIMHDWILEAVARGGILPNPPKKKRPPAPITPLARDTIRPFSSVRRGTTTRIFETLLGSRRITVAKGARCWIEGETSSAYIGMTRKYDGVIAFPKSAIAFDNPRVFGDGPTDKRSRADLMLEASTAAERHLRSIVGGAPTMPASAEKD